MNNFLSNINSFKSAARKLTVFFSFLLMFSNLAFANECADQLKNPDPEVEKFAEYSHAAQELMAKVSDRLGIYNDPFRFANSDGKMVQIWKDLKKSFPSLHEISDQYPKALSGETAFPEETCKKIIQESAAALATGGSDFNKLNGSMEALKRAKALFDLEIAKRLGSDGKPSDEAKNSEGKQEEKKEKPAKPKGPPPPPEYPELSKDYKAHNKDTDSGGEGGKPIPIIEVDLANVVYFRSKNYQIVNAKSNSWVGMELGSASMRSPQYAPKHKLTVWPLNRKGTDCSLLVPSGYRPVIKNDSSGKVFEDSSGNYYFNTPHDQFEIEIVEQGEVLRELSPSEKEIYTSSAGTQLQDWPEKLQHAIVQVKELVDGGKFSEADKNLAVAQILGSFIAKNFLYRVDAKEGTDATLICRNGAFQCDTAATILTSILRDEFKIPARPAGGFQGNNKNDQKSYVVTPATGHAWVEVASPDGSWHVVDPTPVKKDRKVDPKDSEPNEFKPNAPESDEKPDAEEGQGGQEGEGKGVSAGDIGKLKEDWVKTQEKRALERKEQEKQSNPEKQADEAIENGRAGISEIKKTNTDEILKKLEK